MFSLLRKKEKENLSFEKMEKEGKEYQEQLLSCKTFEDWSLFLKELHKKHQEFFKTKFNFLFLEEMKEVLSKEEEEKFLQYMKENINLQKDFLTWGIAGIYTRFEIVYTFLLYEKLESVFLSYKEKYKNLPQEEDFQTFKKIFQGGK